MAAMMACTELLSAMYEYYFPLLMDDDGTAVSANGFSLEQRNANNAEILLSG